MSAADGFALVDAAALPGWSAAPGAVATEDDVDWQLAATPPAAGRVTA